MENSLTVRQSSGVTVREEFGAVETQRSAETAQTAVAARATAEIQARYIMAERRPRSIEGFRVALLKECARPGFADEAEYERPVGREYDDETREWKQKIARGPSIRLIETALRYFGNVVAESPVVMEAEEFRIIRAQMVDLENNMIWSQDVIVPKRVEKRGDKKGNPPAGRTVISQRINSSGDATFLVAATDDEVSVKQSALNSKAQRKNGERLLPSDIIHEAILKCRKTLESKIADDPDAAMRLVIDGFAALNIKPEDLAEYIGKKLEFIQPAEIAELRRLWKAVKDGEITWQDVMAMRDTVGSRDAQAEVARKKLEDLRKKTGSLPETKTAEPAAEQKDQVKEEPKTDDPRAELAAFESTIGREKFYAVLGEMGYEKVAEVPDAMLSAFISRMKDATVPPKKNLNLGGRK